MPPKLFTPMTAETTPKMPMTGMQMVPSLLMALIPKAAVAVNSTTAIRLIAYCGTPGKKALMALPIRPASTAVQPSNEKASKKPMILEPCFPYA